MTHDADVVVLNLAVGRQILQLHKLGMEWPPPERLYLAGSDEGIREAAPDDDPLYVLKRVRMSELTDEQADHPNLSRGAEYDYEMSRT